MSEVTIAIDGPEFVHWTSAAITLSLDEISTVEISAPMHEDFKGIFTPFKFPVISVEVDGEKLFQGTLMGVNPSISESEWSVSLSAYATAGVLNDSSAPEPLEFSGSRLDIIASQVCGFFAVPVSIEGDPGAPFEKVSLEVGSSPMSLLIDLAKQRGFVITSDAEGGLVFHKSTDFGFPVATLQEGESPLLSYSVSFDPQGYYSEITGISKTKEAAKGGRLTVANPRAGSYYRPLVFEPDDTETGDLQAAVDAKLGRMFANSCSYSVTVSTWQNPAGELWKPGDFVVLDAPKIMVYRPTMLLIRKVVFKQDATSETADLELCLPGAFSGTAPGSLPWED